MIICEYITSYFHTLMVVHLGSNDHLRIHNLIHGNMLSSLSKKRRNGKGLLENGILGVDDKMKVTMLTKHLYIAVWYFYITNRFILGDISRVIYKPTKTTKSNYFTQALQWKLFNINKINTKHTPIFHSITKTQEYINRCGRSFQEYKWLDT